jgi:hypothetical protein
MQRKSVFEEEVEVVRRSPLRLGAKRKLQNHEVVLDLENSLAAGDSEEQH